MKVDTYKVKPRLANIVLLYIFGLAIALYPPLAQFSLPIIFVSFLVIFVVVLYDLFFLQRPIPKSILFNVISVLTLVYLVWLLVAALRGNDMAYAFQDSLGFAIYLMAPIIFIFIYFNKLYEVFFGFLINLCVFIAIVSSGIVVWFFLSFGEVQSESLIAMNALIRSYKLNWVIDNNAGFLGLYTYTAHLLLLGIGLSFYNFYVYKKNIHVYLILLFCFGIFADGHRALVVSMLFLVLLLFPLFKERVSIGKVVVFFFIALIPILLLLFFNIDWIIDRFNFSESDPSTLERFLQIPALLDKIIKHPVMGNGFGSFASVIRSSERPFSYEVDFLATIMKLGFVGGVLYFGAYLYMLNVARRLGDNLGYVLFCIGLSFFIYMGTNGNQAMSTDSSVFHIFLFIMISFSVMRRQNPAIKRDGISSRIGV